MMLDPETEELLMSLFFEGYQPYPEGLNVPYVKDIEGMGSTNPMRGVTTQQGIVKSAESILGYSPVEQYAGPDIQTYTPEYDYVAEEAMGDEVAEGLLGDFESGAGILQLKNALAADPSLSPEQITTYNNWLDRLQQATLKDDIALNTPGTVTDPREADPFGTLPTEEASSFDEDANIANLAKQGVFGSRRQAIERGIGMGPSSEETGVRRIAQAGRQFVTGQRGAPQGISPVSAVVDAARNQVRTGRGLGPRGVVEAAGYRRGEQMAREDLRSQRQQSVRPTAAKERAVRAIMAYRLSMGLPAQ
jgi:hypothetical protein